MDYTSSNLLALCVSGKMSIYTKTETTLYIQANV